FIKDLRYLLRQLPPCHRRQSMLFSATLTHDVMELAYVFMNDAMRVSVTPEQVTAEKVEHLVYHVGVHEKMPLLVGLLRREADARVLVFVNMRRSAERLVRTLEANGLTAAAITGDVDQRRRLKVLTDFKEGRLPILVATDVASRGLHIEGVTHVVNYDLPLDAEDYVHRAGGSGARDAEGGARRLARRPAGAAADRRGGDHGFGREGEHGLPAHPEVPAAGILPPRRSHRAAQNEDELERLAPLRRVPQACADDRRVLVLPDHGAHADIRPWRIQPITRRHHGSARARRGKWSTIAAMPWSS